MQVENVAVRLTAITRPLGSVQRVHRAAAGDAGKRGEHVEAAVLRNGRVDRRSDRILIGDVDLVEPGQRNRRLSEIDADDACALGGEPNARRFAEPGRRAGDERDPAVETADACLRRVLVGHVFPPAQTRDWSPD